MTREECIGLLKRSAEYNGMGIPNLAGCKEAMRMAAELLERHSLSSNLDEAAQRIAYDVCKQLPNGEEKDGIVYYAILAAIAGAEWMAAQGISMEIIDGTKWKDVDLFVHRNVANKVIIQIRQK